MPGGPTLSPCHPVTLPPCHPDSFASDHGKDAPWRGSRALSPRHPVPLFPRLLVSWLPGETAWVDRLALGLVVLLALAAPANRHGRFLGVDRSLWDGGMHDRN